MKKNIFKSSRGYTLVEMLAVIIVFSIIGGIVAVIFASSLRGSNKANITNEIRQNGNYALSQMSKMITYARSFDGISETGEEESYVADCYSDPTTSTIPREYHYLKISDFNDGQTIFVCNDDPEELSSNSASLIDTQVAKIDSCNFSCSQESIVQPPTIKINFTLSQVKTSNLFEHKASILFEVTIVMRNTSR